MTVNVLELSDERDAQLQLRLKAYREGWQEGWAACLDYLADQIGGRIMPAHPTELELRRWHVCCRACRIVGHRAGCTRCEDRTRATFANPHPDDYNKAGPE